MPLYIVLLQPLRHNDVDYDPGDTVDMIEVHAQPLLAAGVLELAPEIVTDSDVIEADLAKLQVDLKKTRKVSTKEKTSAQTH